MLKDGYICVRGQKALLLFLGGVPECSEGEEVNTLHEPTTPIGNDMLRISLPISPPKNRRGVFFFTHL